MLAVNSVGLCVILLQLGFAAADVKTVFNETFENKNIFHFKIHNSLMTDLGWKPMGKWNISHTTVDNRNKLASCEVVIDRDLHGIYIFPLTANETILFYGIKDVAKEIYYTQYVVINFTDCKTHEILKIEYENEYVASDDFIINEDPIYINEDGTFEILTRDYKHCGNKICRYIFDAQGNQVKGPMKLYKPMPVSHRLLYKISSSPNFIIIENDQSGIYRTSLIKADELIVLKSRVYHHAHQHVISTSYGVIRLCNKTNNTKVVNCEVFDSNGKKMSTITVNVTEELGFSKDIEVQNLANGEFLLKIGDGYQRTGTILKLKADGSVIGVAELSYFATDKGQPYPLGDVDLNNDQYCLTRAAVRGDKFKILKQCYSTDSDFH